MKKKKKPMPLYRFAMTILPPIFKLFYRYKIIGKENIPQDGRVLICSNHTVYKDPIFLGLSAKPRQVFFMAKQELFKNKFVGFIIRKLGAFPVERAGGASAIKHGIDLLENDEALGIFIEGTRSKTGELLKPKPGVILLSYDTKAPIVPMAIVGKNGKPPKIFSRTVVRIGKPIAFEELGMTDSTGLEMRKASRKVMAEIKALRDETLREMGVEIVEEDATSKDTTKEKSAKNSKEQDK